LAESEYVRVDTLERDQTEDLHATMMPPRVWSAGKKE
jgi:hypothetical protein